MISRFQTLSRWVLVAAVFYAPWALGCTNLFMERGLLILLGWAFFLWLGTSLFQFRIPKIPWMLFASCAAILIYGWFMMFNAHSLHDDNLMKFVPIMDPWPSLPGSCEKRLSLIMMTRITALLGVIWMMADISRDRTWRRRIFFAIACAGCSIALLGLIQRIFNAPSMLWLNQDHGHSFFATFRYHANAGAYMNLVFPMVAVFWVASMQHEGRHLQRVFWAFGTILLLVAAVVNTSRGAGLIAFFLFVSFIFWQRRFLWKFFKNISRALLVMTSLLSLTLLIALVISSGFHQSIYRWKQLPEHIQTMEERLPAHQAWVRIIPETGFWGSGAGTFRAVSSYYKYYGGESVSQLWWQQAHQDYLQTIIEWGYLGFFFWAVIFIGGIFYAVRYLKQKEEVTGLTNRLLVGASVLAVLGVLLHAMFDFPLQICSIQFYVAILLGMMWGTTSGWETRTTKKRHN